MSCGQHIAWSIGCWVALVVTFPIMKFVHDRLHLHDKTNPPPFWKPLLLLATTLGTMFVIFFVVAGMGTFILDEMSFKKGAQRFIGVLFNTRKTPKE